MPARVVGGLTGDCRPAYPASALRRNEQGRTVVRITVSPDGRAVAATVAVSSGHPTLDTAAIAAVLKVCRFVPARHGDVPIQGTALQPMDFRIGE